MINSPFGNGWYNLFMDFMVNLARVIVVLATLVVSWGFSVLMINLPMLLSLDCRSPAALWGGAECAARSEQSAGESRDAAGQLPFCSETFRNVFPTYFLCLVVTGTWISFSHSVGNFIIPTDFHIFQIGRNHQPVIQLYAHIDFKRWWRPFDMKLHRKYHLVIEHSCGKSAFLVGKSTINGHF